MGNEWRGKSAGVKSTLLVHDNFCMNRMVYVFFFAKNLEFYNLGL